MNRLVPLTGKDLYSAPARTFLTLLKTVVSLQRDLKEVVLENRPPKLKVRVLMDRFTNVFRQLEMRIHD